MTEGDAKQDIRCTSLKFRGEARAGNTSRELVF